VIKIIDVHVADIRFPTSSHSDGSDAMNPDPDYSATYVTLITNSAFNGNGLTFTIGRGNELCVAAVHALKFMLINKDLVEITRNMGVFWRSLVGDSQLRWVGPEKGVVHLATAAIVNALWDLNAKIEGKPLWKLLVDMSPEELVRAVDFRYITDVITPEEAIKMLQENFSTRQQREAEMRLRLSCLYNFCRLVGLFR
jgi:L-fuconate dehydratase